MTDPKSALQELLAQALASVAPEHANTPITLDRTRQAEHGDYATNLAMRLKGALQRNPREIAEALLAALPANRVVARAEIAGAGFINFFLAADAQFSVVSDVLAAGADYGRGNVGQGRPVMVEYVSANPTGPLHVGHGRAAAVGDGIATLLAWQGWKVHREYYYNDAGVQIANLTVSVQARVRQRKDANYPFPETGYHGDYIIEIANAYLAAYPQDPNADDLEAVRAFSVKALRDEQDRDLAAFGVTFDNYYLESSLYSQGLVEKTVQRLIEQGQTYEEGGALWLRTTDYGDDKDRVMRKSDGTYTYFVPDIAYHVTKWERGFTRAVTELGADHHGSLARMWAGLQAMGLGIPKGYPDYVLHQMITVMRGGEEVKISKRAGDYVTVRDLIDEVGRDPVRFFFVMRKHDSQLTFDIDLAKEQSEKNPVLYVQYAHARICSVFAKGNTTPDAVRGADLSLLTSPYEVALAKRLADFPVMLANAAQELSPHLVTFYLRELAGEFHSYNGAEKFLVDDPALRAARLALIAAVAQVIRNGLGIVGVSAPEKM